MGRVVAHQAGVRAVVRAHLPVVQELDGVDLGHAAVGEELRVEVADLAAGEEAHGVLGLVLEGGDARAGLGGRAQGGAAGVAEADDEDVAVVGLDDLFGGGGRRGGAPLGVLDGAAAHHGRGARGRAFALRGASACGSALGGRGLLGPGRAGDGGERGHAECGETGVLDERAARNGVLHGASPFLLVWAAAHMREGCLGGRPVRVRGRVRGAPPSVGSTVAAPVRARNNQYRVMLRAGLFQGVVEIG